MTKDAMTHTRPSDDNGYRRTGIVLREYDKGGSLDILNEKFEIIARINIFTNEDNSWLGVDVIDVKELYKKRTALTFLSGQRASLDAGKTVAADFRRA